MAKARSVPRPAPVSSAPSTISRWFPAVAGVLTAILWLGWFSPEISDSDFWWHLKTGQYIVQKHALPVPDPFAYTTAGAGEAYGGEAVTRYFNLTHEWLAQALFYLVWRTAGFGGVVLFRAALLAAMCGLVGLTAWRRCGGFYRSLAASCATAALAIRFALDRPYLITFLLLAATIAMLEYRRWLWLLPPLFLIWANCHGGFFLGWLVLAAYCAEALWQRSADARQLCLVSAISVLLSGVNPNGFRIFEVLLYYRSSSLTKNLLEWARPPWFAFNEFTALWIAAALLMALAWRRVRVVDWILLAAFLAAAFSAQRNTILVGLIAPVAIVSYFPWKRALGPLVPFAASLVLIGGAMAASWGSAFQLRAAEWRYPAGAADFLLAHHVGGHIFNTYEYGGYLIWRLWPEQQVFIDGRSLSESLFQDYGRILYNVDEPGQSAQQLLDRYGVETIVMNSFEYSEGLVYKLAPALADPQQNEWKLVFEDPAAIVLMRHPPAGVAPLDSLRILTHMEAECELHLRIEPNMPLCARSLAQVFTQVGDQARARQWLATYRQYPNSAR
ncbi:MAG TPA: hypothetical protein VHW09_25105 [Bryobacteraceae bacterium]|jgi:hypothetical protein|nr:hypothetical protein [Bryobacteraceae bacterium]